MSDHKHTFTTIDKVIHVTCGCLRGMMSQEEDTRLVARDSFAARLLHAIEGGGD